VPQAVAHVALIAVVMDCFAPWQFAKRSCRRMAWQEARDGRADDGVRAKDHLLFSVKSRRSKRAQVELFPAWAVKPLFRTTIKARAWQFRVAAKRHQLGESVAEHLGSLEINDQLDLRDSHPCALTQRQLQLLEPR